jgi:sec-independent protein translocase protein TatC
MPLRAHLAELRRRVLISVIAIGFGAVIGWFLYDPVWEALQQPLKDIAQERDVQAQINIGGIATAFNLKIKLSVYLGIVIASPVWLMQIWGFIVPGLTKRERRTSWAFMATAVPLFLSGILLAWLILPNAVKILTEFTPEDASNIISAEDYLNFTTKLLLAFGIAFVIPLLLVALNLVGVLSGAALGRSWRVAVFLVFLFTAIASPSPDAGSMLAMALPMVGLYVITVAVCLLFDRRKAQRREEDPVFGLDDDEASPLGAPGDAGVSASGPLERPAPLDPGQD